MGDLSKMAGISGLLAGLLLVWSASSWASGDSLTERHQSKELAAGIAEADEALWLDAAGQPFMALYRERHMGDLQGAIVILHGLGQHADWPGVIRAVRQQMPLYGWHSLSLQLAKPYDSREARDPKALLDDAAVRIQAGLQYLADKGILNVVLLGHGWGAVAAAHYLAGRDKPGVVALVSVGGAAPGNLASQLDHPALIRELDMPVLDIYGERDLPMVLRGAPARERAADRAGNKAFRQRQVVGADHDFTGLEPVLVKRVRGWVAVNASGHEVELEKSF